MKAYYHISSLSFILLASIITCNCAAHTNTACGNFELWNLLHCATAYVTIRLICSVSHRKQFETVVTAAIAILCLWQAGFGIVQLYSNATTAGITGSFSNSGIYGGFLAVSASMTGVWLMSLHAHRHRQPQQILRYPAAISLTAALVLIPVTMSRAAILSLATVTIVFTLRTPSIRRLLRIKYAFNRKRRLTIICTTIFLTVTAIFTYRIKKDSADGRIFMGRICIEEICRKPLTGAGAGRFTAAYGEGMRRHFQSGHFTDKERVTADCPEYPFNTFLCIGVEYGIPAMLLMFIGTLSVIIYHIRCRSPLGYGLLALSVFAIFSYPQEIMFFRILASTLAAAAFEQEYRHTGAMRLIYRIMILVFATGIAIESNAIRPKLKARKEWQRHITAYQPQTYALVAAKGAGFLQNMGHDHRFLFQYGQALLETGQYEKADSVLQLGASISCDPMFWNLIGRCRQARRKYEEAEKCYVFAFETLPNRLYPLYLLARLYYEEGDSCKLYIMYDYIKSFIPKKESETTLRLRKEVSDMVTQQSGGQDTVFTGIMNVNVVPTPSVESTRSFP